MKIALACPYAWDAPGGVQVHVRELAQQLRDRGHDVRVLAPLLGVGTGEVVAVGKAVRIPYQGTVAPICLSIRSARRVASALSSFEPDVVHAHEPLSPSTGMLATVRSSAPVVATFHAHAERSTLLTVAAPVLKPVWDRLDVRVAVSDAAASFFGRRFRGPVRIVPNGCDVDRFARAGPEPDLPPGRRVLWVGRLDPQKGFGVALAAFHRVAERHQDAVLVVVGDGRDRRLLNAVPSAIRRRVHHVGSVEHDRLAPYYASADVFVAPALGQESFGMVLVEAMAAGAPIVASDIAGYREVVRDGVEALLVPPGDAGRLAEGITGVLADGGLAGRLAEAGRARAERYRWQRIAAELETAYEDAIAAASTRRGNAEGRR